MQHVEQLPLVEGQLEHGRIACRQRRKPLHLVFARRAQDGRRRWIGRCPGETLCQLRADRTAGTVDQCAVVRLGEADFSSQPLRAFLDAFNRDGGGAPGLERIRERHQFSSGKPHEEDSRIGELAAAGFGLLRLLVERDFEPERATQAHCAFQADAPPHELHQLAGDRRSQARAPEAPRGGLVGLRETLEDPLLGLRRDADAGIAHRELEPHRGRTVLLGRHVQCHAAALGELHRVAGEVDQDLAQVVGVAQQCGRDFRHDRHHELHALGRGLRGNDARRAVDQSMQVEGGAFEVQLAGLDLGEVEHLLYEAEHHLGGAAQRLQHVGLLAGELGIAQEVRHADDRVQRRAHFVADDRNEPALCEVGRLGPRQGVEHAVDEGEYVKAENDQPKQQSRPLITMDTPKRAVGQHRHESRAASAEREEQIARPESKAVGERYPNVNQE